MEKIYLTESELRDIIESSTIRVLNEGFGKQLAKGIGYTLLGGPGLAALKAYDALGKGKSVLGLDDVHGNNRNTSATNTNSKINDEPKQTNYGKKLIYNKEIYPKYCEDFKYNNVFDGHLVGNSDYDKGSDVYNIVKEYKISEEERAKKLGEYLEKRDKKWGFKAEPKTAQKQEVNEGVLGTIRNGIRAVRAGRQLKNVASSLMNRNAKIEMAEKEILPLVLTNLCGALSIEKEDPMYTLINSPETKKKIMKLIEKEI